MWRCGNGARRGLLAIVSTSIEALGQISSASVSASLLKATSGKRSCKNVGNILEHNRKTLEHNKQVFVALPKSIMSKF